MSIVSYTVEPRIFFMTPSIERTVDFSPITFYSKKTCFDAYAVLRILTFSTEKVRILDNKDLNTFVLLFNNHVFGVKTKSSCNFTALQINFLFILFNSLHSPKIKLSRNYKLITRHV